MACANAYCDSSRMVAALQVQGGIPHLVLDDAGRGKLWDCSRALCWLASAGGHKHTAHAWLMNSNPAQSLLNTMLDLELLRIVRLL